MKKIPNVGIIPKSNIKIDKEQDVFTRCCIGHTRMTHYDYTIVYGKQPPDCIP
jgi:hypothetical protein